MNQGAQKWFINEDHLSAPCFYNYHHCQNIPLFLKILNLSILRHCFFGDISACCLSTLCCCCCFPRSRRIHEAAGFHCFLLMGDQPSHGIRNIWWCWLASLCWHNGGSQVLRLRPTHILCSFRASLRLLHAVSRFYYMSNREETQNTASVSFSFLLCSWSCPFGMHLRKWARFAQISLQCGMNFLSHNWGYRI